MTKDRLCDFEQQEELLDNPYQIILNRCLFEAVNNILDEFRPYGKEGIPAFYHLLRSETSISLHSLQHRTKQRLSKLL